LINYSLRGLGINICINYLIYIFYDFVSINKILSIISKTHRKVVLHSLLFLFFVSLLLTLFYNTLLIRCSNQLSASRSVFPIKIVLYMPQFKLFLILSSFTIVSYILISVIRIFDFINFNLCVIIIIFIIIMIIIIIIYIAFF